MNADKRGYDVYYFLSAKTAKNAKKHSYLVFSFFASFALFADNVVLICVYLRSSVDIFSKPSTFFLSISSTLWLNVTGT